MKKRFVNFLNYLLLITCAITVLLFLVVILYTIYKEGLHSLSLDFIFSNPSEGMTKGGVFPAVLGTVLLTVLTALVSIPLGVSCAIYLNEYAKPSLSTALIRSSIRNLSGIPSVIYGLFGLALFVQSLQLGTGLFSAGLTLGLLSLPYIITTTEEALKRVPNSLREASLALGATQFETIMKIVIPESISGIMTGVILAISRAAGETAPILFTGVAFYINQSSLSLKNEFMALPYHLYVLSTQHSKIDLVRPLAYSTALVLVSVIFLTNSVALIVRYKYRTKH
ncbi:MAG: phosphate ABC transporter permease PstA [Cytophagales bacterium]